MNLKNLMRQGLSSKGYTLDQTILIIAIIAILVTLIILTVGWSLINKASGTRLASQLHNVQDAIGNYYGDHKIWPLANTSNPVNNAIALAGLIANTSNNTKNYIAGLATSAGGVSHNLNNQANRRVTISQMQGGAGVWTGGANTINEVVEFQNVIGSDFVAADNTIDNSDGGAAGLVRIIAAQAAAPTAGTGCYANAPAFVATADANTYYDVCYLANNVQ